jgi:hypothetical protein
VQLPLNLIRGQKRRWVHMHIGLLPQIPSRRVFLTLDIWTTEFVQQYSHLSKIEIEMLQQENEIRNNNFEVFSAKIKQG